MEIMGMVSKSTLVSVSKHSTSTSSLLNVSVQLVQLVKSGEVAYNSCRELSSINCKETIYI